MGVLIILLVLGILATARLTRLFVSDRLTAPFRRYVVQKWGEGSLQSYFVHCPWCMSMWWGALVMLPTMLLTYFFSWLGIWFIAALSVPVASHITGLLSRLEETE
jgi:hypothetical protein